jgi:hypothetical protein
VAGVVLVGAGGSSNSAPNQAGNLVVKMMATAMAVYGSTQ